MTFALQTLGAASSLQSHPDDVTTYLHGHGSIRHHSEWLQSVVESAASAWGMTAAAAARAASLQDAHASVERLTEQMDGMEARCAELGGQLVGERSARQVDSGTHGWCQCHLLSDFNADCVCSQTQLPTAAVATKCGSVTTTRGLRARPSLLHFPTSASNGCYGAALCPLSGACA